LSINREMNLLNLVTSWIDNICQIKTKVLQCRFFKKKLELNKAIVYLASSRRSYLNVQRFILIYICQSRLRWTHVGFVCLPRLNWLGPISRVQVFLVRLEYSPKKKRLEWYIFFIWWTYICCDFLYRCYLFTLKYCVSHISASPIGHISASPFKLRAGLNSMPLWRLYNHVQLHHVNLLVCSCRSGKQLHP